MKKWIMVLIVGWLLSNTAVADTIFGVYAGAATWEGSYTGEFSSDGQQDVDLEDDQNIDDETNNVFYVALEHPVPLLPNLKLKHTGLETSGSGDIDVTFNDVVFNETVETDIDLTHTDVTFYWELLDNWASLDVGFTGRVFDGEVAVRSLSFPGNDSDIQLDETVPMLYTMAQFDLPFTGFYAGGEVNAIGYSGNKLTDITIKVGYEALKTLGFELGYRQLNLTLDDLDDLDSELDLSGPYASFVIHI